MSSLSKQQYIIYLHSSKQQRLQIRKTISSEGCSTQRAIPVASLWMNSEQSPTLPHLKSCIKSLCNHIPSDLNTLLLKYSVSLDCIWNTRYRIWNVNLMSCVSVRPNTIIISIQTIITLNMVIIPSSFVADRDFTVDFSANNEYSNRSR